MLKLHYSGFKKKKKAALFHFFGPRTSGVYKWPNQIHTNAMYSIRQRQGNTIKIIEIGLGPQSRPLKSLFGFWTITPKQPIICY